MTARRWSEIGVHLAAIVFAAVGVTLSWIAHGDRYDPRWIGLGGLALIGSCVGLRLGETPLVVVQAVAWVVAFTAAVTAPSMSDPWLLGCLAALALGAALPPLRLLRSAADALVAAAMLRLILTSTSQITRGAVAASAALGCLMFSVVLMRRAKLLRHDPLTSASTGLDRLALRWRPSFAAGLLLLVPLVAYALLRLAASTRRRGPAFEPSREALPQDPTPRRDPPGLDIDLAAILTVVVAIAVLIALLVVARRAARQRNTTPWEALVARRIETTGRRIWARRHASQPLAPYGGQLAAALSHPGLARAADAVTTHVYSPSPLGDAARLEVQRELASVGPEVRRYWLQRARSWPQRWRDRRNLRRAR